MGRTVPNKLVVPTTRCIPRQPIATETIVMASSGPAAIRNALCCMYTQQYCEIIDDYRPDNITPIVTSDWPEVTKYYSCVIRPVDGEDHEWAVGIRAVTDASPGDITVTVNGVDCVVTVPPGSVATTIHWELVTIPHDVPQIDVTVEITDYSFMGGIHCMGVILTPQKGELTHPAGPYTADPEFGEIVIPSEYSSWGDGLEFENKAVPCSVGHFGELVSIGRELYRRCYGQALIGVSNTLNITSFYVEIPPSYQEFVYLCVHSYCSNISYPLSIDTGNGDGFIELVDGENTFAITGARSMDAPVIQTMRITGYGQVSGWWYSEPAPSEEPYNPVVEDEE